MISSNGKGVIFGILAALFSALIAMSVKLAVGVPSYSLVFFRNLICFILLLPFMIEKGFSLKTKCIYPYVIRTTAGLLSVFCFYHAAKELILADCILLRNSVPLFTPLVVLFWFKEKFSEKSFLALVVGFVGIILVVKPFFRFLHISGLIGLAAGLLASISLVSVRKLSTTEPTKLIMFYFFSTSTLISAIPTFLYWTPINGWKMWSYVFLVGIFSFGFQYCITKAYTYITPVKASSLSYFGVIFGLILGLTLWTSFPDTWSIIGSFMVISACLYILREKRVSVTISYTERDSKI